MLLNGDTAAKALRDLGYNTTQQLIDFAAAGGPRREHIATRARRIQAKLQNSFNSLMNHSLTLPEVTFTCEDGSGCRRISLARPLAAYYADLLRMRVLIFSVASELQDRIQGRARSAREIRRQAARYFTQGAENISKFPASTFACR